ncbi:hypothetical protein VTK56DRAFT_25 [Thermocarpiscus australiensis]
MRSSNCTIHVDEAYSHPATRRLSGLQTRTPNFQYTAVSMACVLPGRRTAEVQHSIPQKVEDTLHLKFRGINDFFDKVSAAPQDFMIFKDVSPEDYAAIASAIEGGIRLDLYEADTNTLWVTVPTRPHERLHRKLDDYIHDAAAAMGLGDNLQSDGSTDFPTQPPDTGSISIGEGDSTRTPVPPRGGPNAWPTLVIEAGYSQTYRSYTQR